MKSLEAIDSVLRQKGRQVWSISPEATVFEAIRLMSIKNVAALLVMSEGRLEGIITLRDYARRVVLKGLSTQSTLVREVMTGTVRAVCPEEPVGECMRLMLERRIHHLPVIGGEVVVGIVSFGDLANWTISEQDDIIDRLECFLTDR